MRSPMRALAVAAATLALLATPLLATTIHETHVACPVCGTKNVGYNWGSTNSAGGLDRDFLRRAVGSQLFLALPMTCKKCGYTARSADEFGKPVSAELKQQILSGKALAMPRGRIDLRAGRKVYAGWERLDLITQIGRLKKLDDKHLAWRYLETAWAVRLEVNPFESFPHSVQGPEWSKLEQQITGKTEDNRVQRQLAMARLMVPLLAAAAKARRPELAAGTGYLLRNLGEHGALLRALPLLAPCFSKEDWPELETKVKQSIELERKYQRLALASFEKVLAAKAWKDENDRAGLTYLAGELCRRVAQTDCARARFDEVIAMKGAPSHLTRWASEQRALISKD